MSRQNDMIEIRSGTVDDATEIARIYNFYIRGGGVTFDFEEYSTERVAKLIARGHGDAWFVAAKGNALAGWASARQFSERPGYRLSCETAIYLDDASIGSGLADLLQQRIDQHCRDAGIHHAMAKIVGGNKRSLAFHRRYDYQLVGTQKEIGRVDGQWVDVVILQRIFSSTDGSS